MATVLIIDDNDDYRFVFHTLLARQGFAVHEAPNGAEGVRAAIELAPDLIVLDLTMPVMNGWEAMARLRENPATSRIPIIVLTGDRQMRDAPPTEADFEGYLQKPVELSDVLQAMRLVLPDQELPQGLAE